MLCGWWCVAMAMAPWWGWLCRQCPWWLSTSGDLSQRLILVPYFAALCPCLTPTAPSLWSRCQPCSGTKQYRKSPFAISSLPWDSLGLPQFPLAAPGCLLSPRAQQHLGGARDEARLQPRLPCPAVGWAPCPAVPAQGLSLQSCLASATVRAGLSWHRDRSPGLGRAGRTGLDLPLGMPVASRDSGWTGCAAAHSQGATCPGAVPVPWPWGWHRGRPTGSCRGLGLPALPPATWAGGWRDGHACRVSVPGCCGAGGLLPGERSGGCSCPVSHLHPCPLARCRGVIFAEECAVPSDSGGLWGLCYRREAESRACRPVNIASPLRAAWRGDGVFLLPVLPSTRCAPPASRRQAAGLFPGAVALGRG